MPGSGTQKHPTKPLPRNVPCMLLAVLVDSAAESQHPLWPEALQRWSCCCCLACTCSTTNFSVSKFLNSALASAFLQSRAGLKHSSGIRCLIRMDFYEATEKNVLPMGFWHVRSSRA